jgi:hypothetical protein
MKLKKYDEAYKSLLIARSMKPDVFEINYNLGYLEYQKKNYGKRPSFSSSPGKTNRSMSRLSATWE